MVDWQVTATTIYCDAVDAEVTIIVYKDWSTVCVGYEKYGKAFDKDTAKMPKEKRKELGKGLRCESPDCSKVISFRDELFAKENVKTLSEKN